MKYTLTNKTGNTQQLMFVDGSCSKIKSGESVEIDSLSIFPSEKERALQFFKIEEQEEKVEQKKVFKDFKKKESDEIMTENGGNE